MVNISGLCSQRCNPCRLVGGRLGIVIANAPEVGTVMPNAAGSVAPELKFAIPAHYPQLPEWARDVHQVTPASCP